MMVPNSIEWISGNYSWLVNDAVRWMPTNVTLDKLMTIMFGFDGLCPCLPVYFASLNNNNIPSVIPQVGFGKSGAYADLTPLPWKVEILFAIDPWLKKKQCVTFTH